MTERAWPADLSAYSRSPDFTEASIPVALRRSHATKQGVWARLHVLEGRLRFRDLVSGAETVLAPGVHPLIFPAAPHEVEPIGAVRFFVEFMRRA